MAPLFVIFTNYMKLKCLTEYELNKLHCKDIKLTWDLYNHWKWCCRRIFNDVGRYLPLEFKRKTKTPKLPWSGKAHPSPWVPAVDTRALSICQLCPFPLPRFPFEAVPGGGNRLTLKLGKKLKTLKNGNRKSAKRCLG